MPIILQFKVWQIVYIGHDLTTIEHLRIAASDGPDEQLDLRSIARRRSHLIRLPKFPKIEGSKQPATTPTVMKMLATTYCSDLCWLCYWLWRELWRPGKAAALRGAFSNLCFVLTYCCRKQFK